MKIGTRFVVAVIALFAAGLGDAFAQSLTTQPPVPVANSPFVAFVPVNNSPFVVNAGFNTASLQVQGNTVSVVFGPCASCPQAPASGPFLLSLPALPAGVYTLDVAIPGFSPSFPDQFFNFTVGANAASAVSLPALSTWGLAALLATLIFFALRALRRGVYDRH